MKYDSNRKALVLLVCVLALIFVTVSAVLAYLLTSTDPVENIFNPARVACEIVETFDKTTKSNVKVRNTGNTDAYIRAAMIVTWKNSGGEVYAAVPAETTDYSIVWNLAENGWVKGDDGFFYYTKEVAPCTHTDLTACRECLTDVLITSCTPVSGKAPQGYQLSVEIVASAIQSTPDTVAEKEWSNDRVEVDSSSGVLTVTNKGG